MSTALIWVSGIVIVVFLICVTILTAMWMEKR